ncbi:MAG: hypothetical protein K2K21_10330 [Lachnospiraceae bacterium]|nr:hypothetical protein [Lachnospiraceae bacterium]
MAVRLVKFFVGLAMIQLAVATFLAVGLGSDSFTVFMQGLSKVLHISVGAGNCLLTLVLLGIVFWLDRSQLRIGMVLSVAFAGLILNGMTLLLGKVLPSNPSVPVMALEFVSACVVVSFGFSILKSARLGVAPNDALYLAIVKKINKPYGMVRTCVDALYLLLGFVCGGVIGIGTLICVVVIGPMIQFVMTHIIKQDE